MQAGASPDPGEIREAVHRIREIFAREDPLWIREGDLDALPSRVASGAAGSGAELLGFVRRSLYALRRIRE